MVVETYIDLQLFFAAITAPQSARHLGTDPVPRGGRTPVDDPVGLPSPIGMEEEGDWAKTIERNMGATMEYFMSISERNPEVRKWQFM
jgi:hypothetical protein